MVWIFNLKVLEFAVVLQCESVALGVFSLWMDELQLVVVGSDLDWVRQVLLIFLLDVNGNGVVVNELDRLM
jgi:hypothetical protein